MEPGTPLVAAAASLYLAADETIESDDSAIVAFGCDLRRENPTDVEFAKAAFEWVRDNVAHAYDTQDHRVTLTASEVLRERVGLCYAKSHLLAAILRSQGVPAGLCYQRLGNETEGHVVHGLVAVYLNGAWHRQDPRGNRPGVDAQFSVNDEQLAWTVDPDHGEADYPRLYVSPAPEVIATLRSTTDILACALPSDLT